VEGVKSILTWHPLAAVATLFTEQSDVDTHIQEAFQTPNRYDQKRTIPCHIIINMPVLENEERIWKATKEKCHLIYKGKHIRIT
jgi:hypothetical protein